MHYWFDTRKSQYLFGIDKKFCYNDYENLATRKTNKTLNVKTDENG